MFGESPIETKTELGTYFITNFMLLIHLQTKPHLFQQCLQDKNWEVERTLLSDRLAQNCTRKVVLKQLRAMKPTTL